MFSLKSFFNFLNRNKLYTAINIFGFAASLTFVVLITLYIQSELSADANQPKADRIYRMETDIDATWAAKIAEDIQGRYPEIEATMRLQTETFKVKTEEKAATYQHVLLVDSTFFDIFEQQFIQGAHTEALATQQCVVLTETYATKLFGGTQAVGKVIEIDNSSYTITAVIKDFGKSVLKNPDMIIRFETITREWKEYLTTYSASHFNIFVLLKPGASLDNKCADMVEFFKGFYWRFQQTSAKAVIFTPLHASYWKPMDRWRLNSNSRSFVGILSVCALMILTFAVINYINLSVAQTTFRAKEAATRRLLGGTKWQLFSNFIAESTLLCMLSLLLAIVVADAAMPWFNAVMNTTLSVATLSTPVNIAILIGSLIALGFVAGVIPAYAITLFQPIQVVRGDFSRRSRMVYSKVLIGIQYLITIILIGSGITIARQTNYMMTADLGFDRQQLINITNSIWDPKVFSLPDQLKTIPGVKEVALSQGTPTSGSNNNSFTYNDENFSFSVYSGDSLFLSLLKIKIVSETGNVDPKAVWINETGARHMGLKPTDNEIPWGDNEKLPLKGIVQDFHTQSMSEQIGDVLIAPLKFSTTGSSIPWNILIKIDSPNPAKTMKSIAEAYQSFSGGEPFEAHFMDNQVEEWYTQQRQTKSLVEVLSLLAIIISALGILAMSTYFIRQRRSEIAIRKVFGSTNGAIFLKLTKQFIIIIAISFIVAVPIIWYLMSGWLSDFAYHIPLTWDIFALAGAAAFSIAMLTISWKAYQAMMANPVKSLKAE